MDNNDLKKLREEITSVDEDGAKYLAKRFEISKNVAFSKIKTDGDVYIPQRETEVINAVKAKFPLEMDNKIESIMSSIMRISREIQYEILFEYDKDCYIKNLIEIARKKLDNPENIACQGAIGAYSYIAAKRLFPESNRVLVSSFEDCITKVKTNKCDVAVLPLENTTAGTVNDVYDLIAENNVYIVKAITIPIEHKPLVIPGTNIEQIKTVMSHPQALAQCSKFIRKMGWKQIAIENTAVAAIKLKEDNDCTVCAISSQEAARENNMEILPVDICDFKHNQTRFVVISNTPVIEDNINRLSISFKVANASRSGSLSFVLNVFAERGLSMTKILSRPVPQTPWEYSFWVDLDATGSKEDINLGLYQLSKELPKLDILGWYEEI